jgi:two-component system CheB/CheR fusion protein
MKNSAFLQPQFHQRPAYSRLDLISYRNVMIYLGQELQKKLIPLFHFAQRPGGYLFLGPLESAASHNELLGIIDKHRIFEQGNLASPGGGFPARGDKPPEPAWRGVRAEAS